MRPRVLPTFHLMLTMRCLFQVCISNRAYLPMYISCVYSWTRVSLLCIICAGKDRRGKLAHWVKRASFAKIRRLLKIFEQNRQHEVLLTVKNLHDLTRHLSPYSVPIIPRPLPFVEGEHFVVADLLSLIPGGSSPAREVESDATGQELVIITQPAQTSFSSEDFGLAP